MKRHVQIKFKDGRTVIRHAEVTEYIDDTGRVHSLAAYRGIVYEVVGRDFYGPIYGRKEA
jgi:hypothetical protein